MRVIDPGGKRAQSAVLDRRVREEWEAQALCSHWGPGWQALLSSPPSLLLKCFQLLRWPREHLRGPLLGKKLVTTPARTGSSLPNGM